MKDTAQLLAFVCTVHFRSPHCTCGYNAQAFERDSSSSPFSIEPSSFAIYTAVPRSQLLALEISFTIAVDTPFSS